ncbi:MAG: hypothetical protein ACRDRX_13125 [Pseudonocardiaceae bacterium]
MLKMIALIAFIIFTAGVLIGVRCQEINLRRRERRLLEERQRVNEQICALNARLERRHRAEALGSPNSRG